MLESSTKEKQTSFTVLNYLDRASRALGEFKGDIKVNDGLFIHFNGRMRPVPIESCMASPDFVRYLKGYDFDSYLKISSATFSSSARYPGANNRLIWPPNGVFYDTHGNLIIPEVTRLDPPNPYYTYPDRERIDSVSEAFNKVAEAYPEYEQLRNMIEGGKFLEEIDGVRKLNRMPYFQVITPMTIEGLTYDKEKDLFFIKPNLKDALRIAPTEKGVHLLEYVAPRYRIYPENFYQYTGRNASGPSAFEAPTGVDLLGGSWPVLIVNGALAFGRNREDVVEMLRSPNENGRCELTVLNYNGQAYQALQEYLRKIYVDCVPFVYVSDHRHPVCIESCQKSPAFAKFLRNIICSPAS